MTRYEQSREYFLVGNPSSPGTLRRRKLKKGDYEGIQVYYSVGQQRSLRLQALSTPEDAVTFAENMGMMEDTRETLYAIYLNKQNKAMGYRLVSAGGRASAAVDPVLVFGPAIVLQASSIILIHNHPSGDATPSSEDVALTERLESAARTLGLSILDHIVVGADGFGSVHRTRGF